ncbi:hypothetical protein [Brevundimonas aurantiaca]|uniref:pPIWI-associating nuclease domain-containing protein n=1 Tax=Brevundimonas aurantiaca TaxID=74316 RepID=UPI002FDE051A
MTHALEAKMLIPIEDERLPKVVGAISDLTADDEVLSETMSDLGTLSAATLFEGIDPSPDGIFQVSGSNAFEANATVYVTLQYGGAKDGAAMSDAYPASVSGHFDNDKVVIDQVSVDTRSFYE